MDAFAYWPQIEYEWGDSVARWSYLLVARAAMVAAEMLLVAGVAGAGSPTAAQTTPDHVLTGTWQRLPAPGVTGMDVAGATLLESGDVAVMFTARSETPEGACAYTYSPSTNAWAEPFAGPVNGLSGSCFYDDEHFVLGPDGRLHSAAHVIDVSVDPWVVEPSDLGSLAHGVDAIVPLGIGTNALAYLREEGSAGAGFEMLEVDLISRATRLTAGIPDFNRWILQGPADRIWVMEYPEGELSSYEPGDDSWRVESPRSPEFVWGAPAAAFGPDGRIYVWDEVAAFPDLYAWDPELREWLEVPLPADLTGDFWVPAFAAGADGLLYVMDDTQPYSFRPGAVREPSVPDTAMPPAAGEIAVIGTVLACGAALLLLGALTLRGRCSAGLR